MASVTHFAENACDEANAPRTSLNQGLASCAHADDATSKTNPRARIGFCISFSALWMKSNKASGLCDRKASGIHEGWPHLFALLGVKVPNVCVLLCRMAWILHVAGDALLLGELLETQSPTRRMNEIIYLHRPFGLRQAPVVLEVDRRRLLAQQMIGRPFFQDGKQCVAPLERFGERTAQGRRAPDYARLPFLHSLGIDAGLAAVRSDAGDPR